MLPRITITSAIRSGGRNKTAGAMKAVDAADNHETAKWDPAFTEQVANAIGPWIKRWHRAEVRNLHHVPVTGGATPASRCNSPKVCAPLRRWDARY